MKITKERLKEIIKDVLREETEYQKFFKKAFFNKIDAAWKGKGEKKES